MTCIFLKGDRLLEQSKSVDELLKLLNRLFLKSMLSTDVKNVNTELRS